VKINIMAIDPGEATGVASLIGDEDMILHDSIIMPGENVLAWARGVIKFHMNRGNRLFIATERFISGSRTRGHTTQDAAPAIFHVIQQECEDHLNVIFTPQQAADAKIIATNTRLKQLGMFRSGEGHDNDASRHAVLCLAREFPQAYINMLQRHEIIDLTIPEGTSGNSPTR
jgi:hypothetical protein